MKTVTRYKTDDGAEFNTKEEAAKHERLMSSIKKITVGLPKRPKDSDCNFANGHGYIQHQKSKVEAARKKLFKLARATHRTLLSEPAGNDIRSYYFARVLDDSGSPLYPIYIRIVCCINDNTYREYGQPYFANNPDKILGGCINA